MPEIPPGRIETLTPQEDEKLREMWSQLFAVYNAANDVLNEKPQEKPKEPESPQSPRRRSTGLFRWRSNTADSQTAPEVKDTGAKSSTQLAQKYFAGKSKDEIRNTIGSMVKHDHPDSLLLRFLRARKWNVQDALDMFLAVLHWRSVESKVDEDVMKNGEASAVLDEKNGATADKKKHGEGFMKQYRTGKGYMHGTDKQNRPMCYVRVKQHYARDQSPESLERFIIHMIETARLVVAPPVDTVTVVFDLTGFTLSNMDYHPVKFIIQCFERNYPECLGVLLIHNAPWVFQGVWKIIHGWLDPVIANKVKFTNGRAGLEEFIASDHLIKEFEGDEPWVYKYEEPVDGENDKMKDVETRDKLVNERRDLYQQYETLTSEWIAAKTDDERTAIKEKRHAVAKQLNHQYWILDPYIRARSLYDRTGSLLPGGVVDWYGEKSEQEKKAGENAAAVDQTAAIKIDDLGKEMAAVEINNTQNAVAA